MQPQFDTQRYQVLRHLGTGGMGSVYLVKDRERGGVMALKTLDRPDAINLVRFKREFRTLADLHHPNLATLYELVAEQDEWFFTMEYVDGVTFQQWVRPPARQAALRDVSSQSLVATGPAKSSSPTLADEPFAEGDQPSPCGEPSTRQSPVSPDSWAMDPTVKQLTDSVLPGAPDRAGSRLLLSRLHLSLRQLAEGVHALHLSGTVHRDLKPSNVLVTPKGRVVILDFGLTKRRGSQTITGHGLSGTPAYMAPEQIRENDPRPASDWYAVGVMLFEALSGQLPFEGPVLDVLLRKQATRPPSPQTLNPKADHALSELCLDLLDPQPETRPGGNELLERLDRIQRTSPVPEVRQARSQSATRPIPSSLAAPSGDAAHFVGRTLELSRLHEAMKLPPRGRVCAAVIEGGSGLGKTALVDRFLADATAKAQGLPVVALHGRCRERETLPYKAFDAAIDELSQVLSCLPKTDLAYVLPEHVRSLASIFPVLRRLSIIQDPRYAGRTPKDARELRDQAFLALRELLGQLSRLQSVILLLDDLQWADRDSVTLLKALLREPGAPPILLLVTIRPIEAIPHPDLTEALEALRERPETIWLDLAPLSDSEATALAAGLIEAHAEKLQVDAPPPATLAATIVQEARGNPYFITELVHHLEHVSSEDDSSDSFSEELVRLDRLLLRRMEALPDMERAVLKLAALAGRPAPQRVLARAAGCDVGAPDFEKALLSLESARLLRCGGFRAHDLVEPYHDRVREAIATSLPAYERTSLHAALASAMETLDLQEPEWLAVQYLAAGEDHKARLHVRQAASRARKQLAFERAAHLYETAIHLEAEAEPDTVVGLWRDLAECLAAAGRTGDAAEAFLSAAEHDPGARRLDLRHRAAEQLLRGGQIQRGTDLLSEVLREEKLRMASSVRQAMTSVGWRLLWLRLHGTSVEPRPPESIPENVTRRLDVLWSANIGLSVVDTVRSADFLMRFLQLSMRHGDLQRTAAGLSILSGTLAALGGRHLKRARQLCRDAARLAQRSSDPKTVGIALFANALVAYFGGSFREAANELHEAEQHFLTHCHGVPWELATTRSFLCFSLRILGDLKDLAERFDRYTEAADRIGDRYIVANLRTYQSIVWLMRDDPDRAAAEIQDVLAPWPEDSYQVQHLFHLYSRCEQALYRGDPQSAWQQIVQERPRVETSGQLKVSGLRLEFARIRGRAAVALAASLPQNERPPLLKEARRAARVLAKGEHEAARAWGALVEAAITWLTRPAPEHGIEAESNRAALEALDHALERAKRGGTAALAEVVRRQQGELIAGERGTAMREKADAWLTNQGVVRPDRFARCLLPGFETTGGSKLPQS